QRMAIIRGDGDAVAGGLRGPALRLEVVGIVRSVNDVLGGDNREAVATLAFHRKYRGRVAYSTRVLLVRRAAGTSRRDFHVVVDSITRGQLGVFDAETEQRSARHS